MSERPQTPRFDYLSESESGLSYVREKRGGVTRVLTPSELDDFSDPPPCPSCAEQFGCEHFNCAGEPILDEAEVEHAATEQWKSFARLVGVSLQDLERLENIEPHEESWRIVPGVETDMRTQELLLLLQQDDD